MVRRGAGVAVRTFDGAGVRVSIGSAEDNELFVAAANGWATKRSSFPETAVTR